MYKYYHFWKKLQWNEKDPSFINFILFSRKLLNFEPYRLFRFEASDNVVPAITFNRIKISGTFPSKSYVLTLPNVLNNLILPINLNEFNYHEGEEKTENG